MCNPKEIPFPKFVFLNQSQSLIQRSQEARLLMVSCNWRARELQLTIKKNGAERGNQTPCVLSWQVTQIHECWSPIWVGIFSHQRLRRNAIPHQTHAIAEAKKAIEFFINTSRTIAIKPKTEAKISNPNEITMLTSMCTHTSKPLKMLTFELTGAARRPVEWGVRHQGRLHGL